MKRLIGRLFKMDVVCMQYGGYEYFTRLVRRGADGSYVIMNGRPVPLRDRTNLFYLYRAP